MQVHKNRTLYLALIAAAVLVPVMADSTAFAAEPQERARRSRAAPPAQVVVPSLSQPGATGAPSGPVAQLCFDTVVLPAPVAAVMETPEPNAASDGRQRRDRSVRGGSAAQLPPPVPTILSIPVPCPGDVAGGGLLLGGALPQPGDTGSAGQGPTEDGGSGGLGGGGDPLAALPLPPLPGLGDGGFGGDGPSGLPFEDAPGGTHGTAPIDSQALVAVPDPGQPNGIPEPSALALMGLGALAIGVARRRRR